MESILSSYEKLKRIDNIEDVAHTQLFDNYFKYNIKDDKKLIDIDSLSQESQILNINVAVPGVIYTFINLNKKNISYLINYKEGNTLEFHDFIPILFCTSYDSFRKIIKGLNLNMLPSIERLKFLEAFYQTYKDFFKGIEEDFFNKKIPLNEKYIFDSISGRNPEIFEKFNLLYRAKFDFAYRSYKLENLRNYRMIEFSEWKYIPFFNPKISFKKTTLQKIYDMYQNYLNKT